MSNKNMTKKVNNANATKLSFIQRFNKKNPIQKSWFFWTAIVGLALLTMIEYLDANIGILGGAKEGRALMSENIRISFAWTATTAAAIGLFKLIRQEKDWLWWFAYGVIALGVNGLWLGKLAQLIKRVGQVGILFYSGYVWSKQAKKHLPANVPMPPKGVMPITSTPKNEMMQAFLALSIAILVFGYILPQFLPAEAAIFDGSSKMFGVYQTEAFVNGVAVELSEIGLEKTKAAGTVVEITEGAFVGSEAVFQNTKTGETLSKVQEYFDSIAIFGAFWGSWSMVNKRWQSQSFKFFGDFMTLIGYLIMGAWVSVFSQLIFNTVQLFGMTDWKEQSDNNESKGLTTVEAYVEYKFSA